MLAFALRFYKCTITFTAARLSAETIRILCYQSLLDFTVAIEINRVPIRTIHVFGLSVA